ncbi:MAG: acetyl-CoA hydrolase/transferase C-terminal domain-containing protein, partial [Oscillospiraceae bacterium]
EGSVVTTPRFLVQYLVTEYGVVDVYLKSIKDRIKAIISIAHPDFREELKQKAIAMKIIGEEDF